MNKIEHIPAKIIHNSNLEQRAWYAQTQRSRGVPLDTVNALRVFQFPALQLVGHQKECMNSVYQLCT